METKTEAVKIVFTTTVDKALLKRLKMLAVEKELPINKLVEEALALYLKKEEKLIK